MAKMTDKDVYVVKKELTQMPRWKRSASPEIILEDAANNTGDPVITRKMLV